MGCTVVTHGGGIVGVEAAEQRRLVQRMHLAIQQLFHDFRQFVGVVLVVDEEHDGQIAALSPRPFAQQRVVSLRYIRLNNSVHKISIEMTWITQGNKKKSFFSGV